MPNKVLRYFVPNICATMPLVGGTVDNQSRPSYPKIIEFNRDGGEKINTQILTLLKNIKYLEDFFSIFCSR